MYKNRMLYFVSTVATLSASLSFAQSGSHGKIHHPEQQQQQQQERGRSSNYPLYREEHLIISTLNSCVIEYDKALFKPLRQAYDSKWLILPYVRHQKIWHEYRKLEKKFNDEFMPKSSPACAEQEEQALEKLKKSIASHPGS